MTSHHGHSHAHHTDEPQGRVVSFAPHLESPITPLDEERDSDRFTDTDSEFEEYEQCDCVDENIKDDKIPYITVYDSKEEEEKRGYFIPSKSIKATIVSYQRDTDRSVHLFSPYLYTVNLEHGSYKWTVQKRYTDFQNLHNHLVMFRAAQKLSAPMKRLRPHRNRTPRPVMLARRTSEGLEEQQLHSPLIHNLSAGEDMPDYRAESKAEKVDSDINILKRRSTQHSSTPRAPIASFEAPKGSVVATMMEGKPQITTTTSDTKAKIVSSPSSDATDGERGGSPRKRAHKMPKFPFVPDSLIGEDNIETRRDDLQNYLDGILHIPSLRNHKETAEFLEVSRLSFVSNLGYKRKEGIVKKRPGGRHDTPTVRLYCREHCGKWNKRWMVVKDSFIAYINPHTNLVREVMLFDSDFEVMTSGYQIEGVNHGVEFKNYSRNLVIKAENDLEANQWKSEVDSVLATTGKTWKETSQFGSFFPVRHHSYAQWFVDGKSFMDQAAMMMDLAKEEIFITDWFLSPELYLRRPPSKGSKWQLMEILNRKAKQGVHVFVLLYKEVEMVLGIGSGRAKQVLMALDPNILVIRHPETVPIPTMWAHHEKIVVIDQNIAFIGGIDLCFGRWDDFRHKLTDVGPEKLHTEDSMGGEVRRPITTMDEIEAKAEIMPLQSAEETSPAEEIPTGEGVLFTETPPLVLKVAKQQSIPRDSVEADGKEKSPSPTVGSKWKLLTKHGQDVANGEPPSTVETVHSPESVPTRWAHVQAKVLSDIHEPLAVIQPGGTGSANDPMTLKKRDLAEIVKKYQEYVDSGKAKQKKLKENTPPMQRKKNKLKLVLDKWKQKSQHDEEDEIYKEYERMISVEFQESQMDSGDGRGILWIGKDYVNFIYKDVIDLEHAYCDFVNRDQIPRLPWHDISSVVYGSAARDAGRHFIQRWNQIKVEKFKYDDTYPFLVPKSYDNVQIPNAFRRMSQRCTAQVLRSGCLWSCGINCRNESIHQAYISMITNAEHYIYIENQFFISMIGSSDVSNLICKTLFERIVKAHRLQQKFRVYVVLPLLPAFEGELGTPTGLNMQTVLYWTYNSICKGPYSLLANLEKENIDYDQYIGFYSLRTHGDLCGRLVSELIYIHSKLIIVDDKFTLIGSANINDRSQLGDRDSEMALFVEDDDFIDSLMDGENYKAGKFSSSLRRQLFSEHLGLLDEMGKPDAEAKFDVTDPICDEMFNHIKSVAKTNTRIYEKVFNCYPTDLTRNYDQLNKYKKEIATAPALVDRATSFDTLSGVQGYLVDFPLKFLSEENLAPPLLSKEGMAPTSLYT